MSNKKVERTDAEWREMLTPIQYTVLRQAGTERAFTGALYSEKKPGNYHCAGCDAFLFTSDGKYDSGCGWPSFFEPCDEDKIVYKEDLSHGMKRTEILCARCDGHLGHVFPDGPPPTGTRYCVNSASLRFEEKKES